jgi:hypothetical protein
MGASNASANSRAHLTGFESEREAMAATGWINPARTKIRAHLRCGALMPAYQSKAAAFAEFRDGLGLDKPLYTREDLQTLFGWSERHVDRLLRSGRLRVTNIGDHSPRVSRGDLAKYLWEQSRQPDRPEPQGKPVADQTHIGRPRTNPRIKVGGER